MEDIQQNLAQSEGKKISTVQKLSRFKSHLALE